MKEWLSNLGSRERMMIALGSAGLGVAVILGLWISLNSDVARLEQVVKDKKMLETWMQAASQKAKQLQRSGNQSNQSRGQSLLALVDRTAKQGRLGGAMKRVEPEGQDKVRIRLEVAKFDDVTRWLEQLDKQYNIHVGKITIDKDDQSGFVNARITLEGTS
ncbi:MAG: type II secretion system protein GspM [Gammaproteobacteria bacterium]